MLTIATYKYLNTFLDASHTSKPDIVVGVTTGPTLPSKPSELVVGLPDDPQYTEAASELSDD